MLKLVSWFVLEVLPYVLSALIAAIVVPGFLYSQVYGTKAGVTANVPSNGWDHATFAPDHTLRGGSAKTSGYQLAYR
jgi:hypothetical protein